MDILHVIPSIPKSRGGPSQAILEMVSSLRQSTQVNAEIATTNDDGESLLDVPLRERVVYQGVPVYFFSRFSPGHHKIREYAFSMEFTKWLWREIDQYDLLHIHALFSYLPTVAMAIARIKRKNYIVQPHGMLCTWALRQSQRQKNIYLDVIERQNLQRSNGLLLTSEKETRELKTIFETPPPCFTVPLGLHVSNLSPNEKSSPRLVELLNISPESPVILFLSRLHPVKGLEYLIPALSMVKEHPFTFVLAGSGSSKYEAEIKTLLKRYNIWDKTRMIGFVEGEIKEILLKNSDLFVLTSQSESFGVAVLEALAAGLPVLVTPGVALANIVEQAEVGFVSDLNVGSIAQTIENALDQPPALEKMGNKAKQLASQKYSWNNVAIEIASVYSATLKK